MKEKLSNDRETIVGNVVCQGSEGLATRALNSRNTIPHFLHKYCWDFSSLNYACKLLPTINM